MSSAHTQDEQGRDRACVSEPTQAPARPWTAAPFPAPLTDDLRARRLHQEWRLIEELARANPGIIEVVGRRSEARTDEFMIWLHQTPAIVNPAAALERCSHRVTFRFPRFFPSVPIEVYLAEAVFHPNTDPQTGFVCLWTRTSAGDTVMEAVRRLQQILSGKLFNLAADHLMQPAAGKWYEQRRTRPDSPLPLAFTAVREIAAFRLETSYRRPAKRPRRRLERF